MMNKKKKKKKKGTKGIAKKTQASTSKTLPQVVKMSSAPIKAAPKAVDPDLCSFCCVKVKKQEQPPWRSSCGHSGHQTCISFLDEYDFLSCAVQNCPVSHTLCLGLSTMKVEKTSTQSIDALPLKLKILSFQLQKLTNCPTLEDLAKQQKKNEVIRPLNAQTSGVEDASISSKEDSKEQYKNPFVKGKGYGSGGSSSYGVATIAAVGAKEKNKKDERLGKVLQELQISLSKLAGLTKEEKKSLPRDGPKGFRFQASCLLPWLLRFFKGLSFLELTDTLDHSNPSSAQNCRLAQLEAAIDISSLLATLSPVLVTKPVSKQCSLQTVVKSTAAEAGLLLKTLTPSSPSSTFPKKVDSPARKRSSSSSIPPISSTCSSKSNSPSPSPKISPSKSPLPQESSHGDTTAWKVLSLFSSSVSKTTPSATQTALAKAPVPVKDVSALPSSAFIPLAPALPEGIDALDKTIRRVKNNSFTVSSSSSTLLKACTSIVSLSKQLTALPQQASLSSKSPSPKTIFPRSLLQREKGEGKQIKLVHNAALITHKDVEMAMKSAVKDREGKKGGAGSSKNALFSLHDALLSSQRFKMQKESLSGYKYLKKAPVPSPVGRPSTAGTAAKSVMSGKAVQRLAMEFHALRSSLPLHFNSSAFLRVLDSDCSQAQLMIMPHPDTPYGHGCFLFDIQFPANYPQSPPKVNLQTTGKGTVRFNPNLYACGKVCLSLLGTWSGAPEEQWNPKQSTFLQLCVSLQSLIFVEDPYYNEPGYNSVNLSESKRYISRIRAKTVQWAMIGMLNNPPAGFEYVVRTHFTTHREAILSMVEGWLSDGYTISPDKEELAKYVDELKQLLGKVVLPTFPKDDSEEESDEEEWSD